jgi:hypothetical protein
MKLHVLTSQTIRVLQLSIFGAVADRLGRGHDRDRLDVGLLATKDVSFAIRRAEIVKLTMTAEQYQRVKHLVQAALERDEGERVKFVTRTTEGDDELRAQVLSLLEAVGPDTLPEARAANAGAARCSPGVRLPTPGDSTSARKCATGWPAA